MNCPFCKSDNLVTKDEFDERCSEVNIPTHCCEDCGGSYQIVQEPQEILLKDSLEKNN